MKKYSRLSLEEREQIFALLSQGKSNREIAITLGRAHSTISREVRRCGARCVYSPSKAHNLFLKQNPLKGRKKILDKRPEVIQDVIENLFNNLSPEQISQKLKKEYANEPLRWISHELIYQYIYAIPRGELKKFW